MKELGLTLLVGLKGANGLNGKSYDQLALYHL